MKYFLPGLFVVIALCFVSLFGYTVYLSIVDEVYWLGVSIGLLGPAIITTLIASAAVDAVKNWE